MCVNCKGVKMKMYEEFYKDLREYVAVLLKQQPDKIEAVTSIIYNLIIEAVGDPDFFPRLWLKGFVTGLLVASARDDYPTQSPNNIIKNSNFN